MALQQCLFDAARTPSTEPQVDPLFRGLRRLELGAGAWVDHLPRWLLGHQQVYDTLAAGLCWKAGQREMYERVVDIPRLLAPIPDGGGHPVLGLISALLCRRYDRPLTRLTAAWYRDGRDSVAPHGDKVLHRDDALVATVSLGQPRPFTLRPVGGGTGPTLQLGWGDLVVMGGTCQSTWLHGIPKQPSAGPRISVMFREDREP